MATKLFLRDTSNSGIGNFYDMVGSAGSSTSTGVVNTTASGTEIQWTRTAGGTVLEWISGRVPSGGFTLSGTMTFSIWAQESNMLANCGARARVFKRAANGTETEVGGGPYNDGVEFGTSTGEFDWTGTPSSTSFAENDRIVVRYYITNAGGTMATGYTCTITYNGADAATGDSFFQINENVTFKAEPQTLSGATTLTGTGVLAAEGTLIPFVFEDGFRITQENDDRIIENGDFRVTEEYSAGSTLTGETSLTASGTFSAVASKKLNALSALNATGTATYVATKKLNALSALSGAGTIASIASKQLNAVSALSASGTLIATSDSTKVIFSSLTGVGTFAAVADRTTNATVNIAGAGTISAVASRKVSGLAAFSGNGTLATIGSKKLNALSTFSATGTLVSNVNKTLNASTSLTATGSKVSVGVRTIFGATSLSASGSLAAIADLSSAQFSNLSAAGTISPSATLIRNAAGNLIGVGSVAATAIRKQFGFANLTASSSLVVEEFSSIVWVKTNGVWEQSIPYVKAEFNFRVLESGDKRVTQNDKSRVTQDDAEWVIPIKIYKKEDSVWKRAY